MKKIMTGMQADRRRSVRFYKYFLSYVLLLVIMLLIVSIVVFSNIIQTFQDEVESSTTIGLTQIRDTVESKMKELEKIALQIGSNPDMTPFMVADEGYPTYRAITELGKYRSSNFLIYDLALLYTYRDTGKLYAASGVYSYESYFNYIYRYENWGKSEFFAQLERMTSPVIRSAETININGVGSNRQFVTYICPLPINQGKPYGAVMFLIEEKMLSQILSNVISKYSGYMYILDKHKNPIISLRSGKLEQTAQEFLSGLDEAALASQATEVHNRYGSYSVIKVSSDYNEWSYVTVIPTDQILQKVQQSRHIFTYSAVIIFLIGIFISYILANNNYGSLRNIVQMIVDRKVLKGTSDNMDEISYLSQAFDEVITEKEGLMSQLGSKRGMMKERLLLSLLKGKQDVQPQHLQNMMEASALTFSYSSFSTLLFFIDDYNRFRTENSLSMQNLFKFSIINIAEELSGEVGDGYGVDLIDDRGIALVLNLKADKNNKEHITALAVKIKNFFRENYKFSLTVGVSRIYNDLSRVCDTYTEANKAILYRFIKGNDQIIFYEDMDWEKQKPYRYPTELEEQLVRMIKQGKAEESQLIVEEIFDEIVKHSFSLEAAKYISSGIINKVFNTMDEMNYKLNDYFQKDLELLIYQEFETLEMTKRKICEFCKQLSQYIADQKESKNVDLCDEIIAYLKEHYNDNSLSQESIAREFDLSPSYLSRFIKDQTGYTQKQHIDLLRMNEAKKLLTTSNHTVKQIVEQVGYVDETNFIRKFKKMEGITPMLYRKANYSRHLNREST
ncbi:helix-turn-helix domain-containing protein [Paenibacillus sp. LMG 31456]|uniref:Helix-turn-helix domain-containing protein n=2 Tax=Paenibacillus foliorum TaxID=2654974 RepID=A0A972K0M7_9BACL|nr:helix-turn-helix domain-containing protein [Paenibacillus foliorum]